MLKLVYRLKKRPDLSDDEFHDYWLNRHGPLVRKLAPPFKVLRYVQSHTVPPALHGPVKATRGPGEIYDGIAELCRDSLDTFIDAYGSPQGIEADSALMEDESRFIDFAGSRILFTEEHAILDE